MLVQPLPFVGRIFDKMHRKVDNSVVIHFSIHSDRTRPIRTGENSVVCIWPATKCLIAVCSGCLFIGISFRIFLFYQIPGDDLSHLDPAVIPKNTSTMKFTRSVMERKLLSKQIMVDAANRASFLLSNHLCQAVELDRFRLARI